MTSTEIRALADAAGIKDMDDDQQCALVIRILVELAATVSDAAVSLASIAKALTSGEVRVDARTHKH